MLAKSIALKALNAALATGGDYAEIYVERNRSSAIGLDNGRVEGASGLLTFGAGIRILKGVLLILKLEISNFFNEAHP